MRIVERLREAADLFREHPVYNSEGDSVLLTVNAALDDEAAALLEQAEAALEEAADQLDACGDMLEGRHVEPLATRRVARSARVLLAKLHEGGE